MQTAWGSWNRRWNFLRVGWLLCLLPEWPWGTMSVCLWGPYPLPAERASWQSGKCDMATGVFLWTHRKQRPFQSSISGFGCMWDYLEPLIPASLTLSLKAWSYFAIQKTHLLDQLLESPSPNFTCYRLNCVPHPTKFLCWSPDPLYLGMWLYLELW